MYLFFNYLINYNHKYYKKKKRDYSHISETRPIALISFHDISDFNRREIRTSKQEFSPLSRETIRFRLLNA